MRNAQNAKRALLIISDGEDNNSRYSEKDIKRLVREAEYPLYSVGIFDPFEYRSRTQRNSAAPRCSTEVTELTGGRAFTVENVNECRTLPQRSAQSCATSIFWDTTRVNKSHDARWRKIKIKLRAPKGLPPLSVYAKTGYYAPSL